MRWVFSYHILVTIATLVNYITERTQLVKRAKGRSVTLAIHVLFSNIKAWLNGTFHGVSAKHLPRYATEWTYRFNRRGRIAELADFVLRRAVCRRTMTYCQIIDHLQPQHRLQADKDTK